MFLVSLTYSEAYLVFNIISGVRAETPVITRKCIRDKKCVMISLGFYFIVKSMSKNIM